MNLCLREHSLLIEYFALIFHVAMNWKPLYSRAGTGDAVGLIGKHVPVENTRSV